MSTASTKSILDEALELAWAGVKDETLVKEFFLTESSFPKGLILADKEQIWKNMIVRKWAIMNELSKRFKNAQ